jgi:chemotaxis protein MotB
MSKGIGLVCVVLAGAFATGGCSSNDEALADKDRQIAELRSDKDGLQRELDQSKSVQMLAQRQLEEERRRAAETAKPIPAEPEKPASEEPKSDKPAPKRRAAKPIDHKEVETETHDDGSIVYRLKGAATFAPGSTTLTKDGLAAVDKIAAAVRGTAGVIRVEGHTDATPLTGKNKDLYQNNLNLSIARAVAVKERLVQQGRIDSSRVSVVGHGSTRPLVKGTSRDAHAKNRRVEIVVAPD